MRGARAPLVAFVAAVMAVMAGAAFAGCGPKAIVTSPGAPAYPEYMFPADDGDVLAQPRVRRGWDLLQADDLRLAAREFKQTTSQFPNSAAARTGQGYVALASHQYAPALEQFEGVLVRRARYVPALVGRGYALLALKREPEALQAFEAALNGDPTLVDVQRRVEVLRFRNVQATIDAARAARAAGRLDEARLKYTRALEASPDSAFLHRELAGIERQQGNDEAAIGDLRRAAELEPADVDSLTVLAGLLAAHGQMREAEQVYRRAFAVEPSDALAATIAGLAQRTREAELPAEFRQIGGREQISRGELAALIGVRFDSLLRDVPAAQLVITDVTNDWARPWIATVAGTGVMEPYANHTFQPAAPALRADLATAAWRLVALASPTRPGLRPLLVERPQIADVARTHPLYTAAAAAVASGAMPLLTGDRFDAARALSGPEASDVVARLRMLLAVE